MNGLKMIDIQDVLAVEMNKAILRTISTKPTTRVLNLDELSEHDIKEYLQSRGTILWSNWTITSEDSLEEAIRWFKDQIDKLYSFIASKQAN